MYVSPGGSNSKGKGTAAKPFRTIAKALTVSNNIIVLPGTYTESISLTGEIHPVTVPNGPVQSVMGDITTVVIRGLSDYNTRINLTTPITCDKVSLTLNGLTVAAINSPAIEAHASLLNIENCYIQSTYNAQSGGGTNYIIHTVNTLTRFQAALISLTEPPNPTNIIMFYAEGNTSVLEYTRFLHNAFNAQGSDVLTGFNIVGGFGDFTITSTEVLLEAPGNDQFGKITMVKPTGPLRLSMANNTFTTITPNTPIPAGKEFRLIDNAPTGSSITVTNQSIIGLDRFETVDTSLPEGSYQNIAWDQAEVSTPFSVNKRGGIKVSDFSTMTTQAQGSYTLKEGDYLVSGASRVSLPASSEGRIVVIANTTNGTTLIVGPIISSYAVQGAVGLRPSETATFQYSSDKWIQIGGTQRR